MSNAKISDATPAETNRIVLILTGALFLSSGIAALLYQIAWQRTLFGWFGVDLDSVSVIVSIFMLGLGGGALVGGWLADRFAKHRIFVFSLIEWTIGAFGLVSLELMDRIGVTFSGAALPALVILTFIVFAIPTFAMGATLPVLVTELVERTHNVGQSTGWLYFINTLGAALGAFAASYVILPRAGLDGLVNTAVTLNFLIGLTGYFVLRRFK